MPAPQPKRLLEIHGGHNSAFLDSADIYNPALREFFAEVLATPASRHP